MCIVWVYQLITFDNWLLANHVQVRHHIIFLFISSEQSFLHEDRFPLKVK